MQPPSFTLQQLLREEPFVRALARQLVAEEAEDVVQQTFLRSLERAPTAVEAPRGWLARVVRNLAQDLRRCRRRRLARESEVAREAAVPSSQELIEVEELRRAVVAAVDALPEPQRTVVLLRYYEGLPPRRIATHLSIPAATVSHRLHEAIGMLRERLDRGHGGVRRAWALPLSTLARLPQRLPLAEVLAHPVATPDLPLFTMWTKPLLACLVALLLSLCWLLWPASSAPPPVAERPDAATPVAATLAGSPSEARAPLPRAFVVTPQVSGKFAGTGTLAVTVVHAEQPRAGAGVVVMVRPVAGHARLDLTTAVTDAAGRVEFADLVPGRWAVRTAGRPTREAVVEVRSGQRTEHTLALDGNLTVRGIVVSPLGVPVADASIEAALPAFTSADAHRVATSRAGVRRVAALLPARRRGRRG